MLCERVLAIDPQQRDAQHLNAMILRTEGRWSDALDTLKILIERSPHSPDLHIDLADTYALSGDLKKALASYYASLRLKNNSKVLGAVGSIHHKLGDYGSAVASYKKAIECNPLVASAYNGLGFVMLTAGHYDEAIKYFEQAIKIDPAYAQAHNYIGRAYYLNGDYDSALRAFKDAIAIKPDYVAAIVNLANLYKDQAEIFAAIKAYRHALGLDPSNNRILSNYLMALNYCESVSIKEIYDEHTRIGHRIEQNVQQVEHRHYGRSDATGRLKIGYLSADFNDHAVASFILPLLRNHNYHKVAIYCYYNRHAYDHVTEDIKGMADYWRNIAGVADKEVVRLIQQDDINILVDLAGHTAENRINVIASKPAPISVNWIGYPNTSGLSVMDYRITDFNTDPPGYSEAYHTEKLVRMPELFCVYEPPFNTPPVSKLPALDKGYITFGCFNNLAKLATPVIEAWTDILLSMTDAKLMIKYSGLGSANIRRALLQRFARHGIEEKRIILLGRDASRYEHLQRYSDIDIALDVFPYNGTTTTCEALWMGVPVISIKGNAHVSRVTFSIMKALGMERYIADTKSGYIDIACELSRDLYGLSHLRETLRDNMRTSVVTDGKRFTECLESKFHKMWQEYCLSKN